MRALGAQGTDHKGRRLRRALGVAGLWLALLALAFLYTDRDANTQRFDAGDAPLLLVDEAQAAALDAQAAALGADGGDGSRLLLQAREDGETGVNLMPGEYEIAIAYTSPQALSLRVLAPGRQAFVTGGEATLPAAPEGGKATLSFALSGAAPGVVLCGDALQSLEVAEIAVRAAHPPRVSPDLLAYALIAGGVLTLLLVLSWDASERGRARRRVAFALVCAALFASMPSLWGGMIAGHDLTFHLNRIEGIASALRCGQFPARIHASTLLGYGYAAPEFYPELFLYFPALLRLAGASLAACLCVFQISVNLLTAALAYFGARTLLSSRRAAVGASILYTLSVYRVANLYVRASLGESVALAFAPLLIAAMADVLLGDERRWPLLALAMIGVLLSHLLSALFFTVLCAVSALLCLPRLLREPRRLPAILKAAALTALCALWFLVPLLDYTAAGVSTDVLFDSAVNRLTPGSLLVAFSGNPAFSAMEDQDFAYHIGVVPGVAVLVGCALLAARLYAQGGALRARASLECEPGRDKLSLCLLLLGGVTLLLSTGLFPWERAVAARAPISRLFRQIQFPWRLAGVATPLLALAAARGYGDGRHGRAGMAALLCLSVVFCGYTTTMIAARGARYGADAFCDTALVQREYLFDEVYKSALHPGEISVGMGEGETLSLEKDGTTLTARIELEGGCAYFDVPLLYYPGYRATVNGAPATVQRAESGVLRVLNTGAVPQIELRVWYAADGKWLLAQGASLAGAALLVALLLALRARRA